MKDTISKWWNAERVNRAEKDTSQDFCPTNGDVVIFSLFCGGWCVPIVILEILQIV